MTNKPINQKVKVTFFAPTGKYKYSAVATVNHFIFEPEFKQDIVNTQDGIHDGWQGQFYVLTDMYDEADYDDPHASFVTRLYHPRDFAGIKKQTRKDVGTHVSRHS